MNCWFRFRYFMQMCMRKKYFRKSLMLELCNYVLTCLWFGKTHLIIPLLMVIFHEFHNQFCSSNGRLGWLAWPRLWGFKPTFLHILFTYFRRKSWKSFWILITKMQIFSPITIITFWKKVFEGSIKKFRNDFSKNLI